MNYYRTNRDATYLFTVKTRLNTVSPHLTVRSITEEFFRIVNQKAKDFGIKLQRRGRLRNRKSKGISRVNGGVKLSDADRWDLYVDVPYNQRTNFQSVAQSFLWEISNKIMEFQSLIEYVNPVYKSLFETMFAFYKPASADSLKIQISPEPAHELVQSIKNVIYNKPMNKTQKYKVKLTAELDVPFTGSGPCVSDVEKYLNALGFDKTDLLDATPIDEHRNLPLVQFMYDEELFDRSLRVVSMDDTYLKGYELSQFKSFRVDKIAGDVKLVAVPVNNQ